MKVGGKRCRVGAATPLSVLAATKLKLGFARLRQLRQRPRDAGGLYVTKVAGEREKGRGGWVYKVGRRAGTPAPPTRRPVRHRPPAPRRPAVTWFWCELDAVRRLPAHARGAARPHERGARARRCA